MFDNLINGISVIYVIWLVLKPNSLRDKLTIEGMKLLLYNYVNRSHQAYVLFLYNTWVTWWAFVLEEIYGKTISKSRWINRNFKRKRYGN